MVIAKKDYLGELAQKRKESRAYTKHQLIGTEIAEMLGDLKHIALYIKLAKERNPSDLIRIAKEISANKQVRKKGAYFMAVISKEALLKQTGTKLSNNL